MAKLNMLIINGKSYEIQGVLSDEDRAAIAGKLDKPENAPEVGKILKVLSVNEDGTFTCQWADAPICGIEDVQVDGTSVVSDGIAQIPVAGYVNEKDIIRTGLVTIPNGYGLGFQWNTKSLIIANPSKALISNRNSNWQADYYALNVKNIDYAVQSAMCDGVGAAWTDAQRLAALLRMGCTVDDEGIVRWTAQEV